MAAHMKVTACWDIALCSLVDVDRFFRGAYCLHHASETSVNFTSLHDAISQKSVIYVLYLYIEQ